MTVRAPHVALSDLLADFTPRSRLDQDRHISQFLASNMIEFENNGVCLATINTWMCTKVIRYLLSHLRQPDRTACIDLRAHSYFVTRVITRSIDRVATSTIDLRTIGSTGRSREFSQWLVCFATTAMFEHVTIMCLELRIET